MIQSQEPTHVILMHNPLNTGTQEDLCLGSGHAMGSLERQTRMGPDALADTEGRRDGIWPAGVFRDGCGKF